MIEDLKSILLKNLASVRREVEAYPDEASLWRVLPGTANPGGNLALHLAGNLQYLIGAQLGGTGYVRDREREFAERAKPRAQVLGELDAAARAMEGALGRLEPAALDRPFPIPFAGQPILTGNLLLQLVAHLAYHLGQINYHRRLS